MILHADQILIQDFNFMDKSCDLQRRRTRKLTEKDNLKVVAFFMIKDLRNGNNFSLLKYSLIAFKLLAERRLLWRSVCFMNDFYLSATTIGYYAT